MGEKKPRLPIRAKKTKTTQENRIYKGPWTPTEVEYIRLTIDDPLDEVAKQLNRTPGSIKSKRLEQIKKDAKPLVEGSHYLKGPEEEEYIKAVLKFRSIHKRPPTLQEGLQIALSLGYRKVAPKQPIPKTPSGVK